MARHDTVYLPSTVLGAFMDVAHPWIAPGGRFLVRHIPALVRPVFRGFLSELLPEPMLGLLGFPARSGTTRLHFRVVRRMLWLFNRVTPPSLRYADPHHEALARLDGRSRVPLTARIGNRAVARRPTVLT